MTYYLIRYPMIGGPADGMGALVPYGTGHVSLKLHGKFPRWAEYLLSPANVLVFTAIEIEPRGYEVSHDA